MSLKMGFKNWLAHFSELEYNPMFLANVIGCCRNMTNHMWLMLMKCLLKQVSWGPCSFCPESYHNNANLKKVTWD